MTANPDTCPRCRNPALHVDGRWLEPEPHPLGIDKPDGTTLTTFEHMCALRQGKPAGHRPHVCPPAPPEPTLF